MFNRSSENSKREQSQRPRMSDILKLGVQYVDDALVGFVPDDFVLIGAYSGMGKTQLCCNIAMANPGKRIHMFALEASEFEIERRLKYSIIKRMYFDDPTRPHVVDFRYRKWILGEFDGLLKCYERDAQKEFEKSYQNLHVLYKKDSFEVADLIRHVYDISGESDGIIIDHAHYFDFGNETENSALKQIAKASRTLALEQRKPVILAAHLRKKDRGNTEMVPGLDEFHGSSDLSKIATTVITMSQGGITQDNCYETIFRIAKDRHGGEAARYAGQEVFNPKIGSYEKNRYRVGWANQERGNAFEEVDREHKPEWSRRSSDESSNSSNGTKRLRNEFNYEAQTRSTALQEVFGAGARE